MTRLLVSLVVDQPQTGFSKPRFMLLSVLLLAIAPRTIIFIVLVLVLFFGAKRIPELMRGMGQGIREFKDASKEPQAQYRDQPANPQNPNAAGNPNQRQA